MLRCAQIHHKYNGKIPDIQDTLNARQAQPDLSLAQPANKGYCYVYVTALQSFLKAGYVYYPPCQSPGSILSLRPHSRMHRHKNDYSIKTDRNFHSRILR